MFSKKKRVRTRTVPYSIVCEERCELGEGPSYNEETNTAWWFDILGSKLHHAHLTCGSVGTTKLPFMASAMAWIDSERQLIAAQNGLYIRTVRDGRLSLYKPLESDNAATRSNDARVHPSGAFWVSTMGKHAEKHAGTIYHLLAGEVTTLFPNVTIPNAICFSPDGSVGYFTDTVERRLYRVSLDASTGKPVGEPSVLFRHRGKGGLDGAIVGRDGLIWNARWGAGCVDAYTPEGERVRSIRVPAKQSSCPAFVGRDFGRLLVTSAFENLTEQDKPSDPHHGKTFVLDVSVAGQPEPRVRI